MPETNTRRDGSRVLQYSTKETAQAIRAALRAAFPAVRFSVTTKYGSMYAAVNIGWTDGPTEPEVDRITGRYSSKTFDGSDDSTHYHDQIVDGARVRYSGWINTSRQISPALWTRAIARVQATAGRPIDLRWDAGSGCTGADAHGEYRDQLYQTARRMRPNGVLVTLK